MSFISEDDIDRTLRNPRSQTKKRLRTVASTLRIRGDEMDARDLEDELDRRGDIEFRQPVLPDFSKAVYPIRDNYLVNQVQQWEPDFHWVADNVDAEDGETAGELENNGDGYTRHHERDNLREVYEEVILEVDRHILEALGE